MKKNDDIAIELTKAEKRFAAKENDKAILTLVNINEAYPDHVELHRKSGEMLMKYNVAQDQALSFFAKALKLAPYDAQNWVSLGSFYKKNGVWQNALDAFQKALELTGENTSIYYEVLSIHQTTGNSGIALNIAEKLIEMEPQNIVFLWKYAQLLDKTGKKQDALKIYGQIVACGRQDIPCEAISEWLNLVQQYGPCNFDVRAAIKKLYLSNPKHLKLKLLYVQTLLAEGAADKALKLLDDIYHRSENSIEIRKSVNSLYAMMGKLEKYSELYHELVSKDPFDVDVLLGMAHFHKFEYGDDIFSRLNFAEAHLSDFSREEKAKLHYALGKAYDDVGEYGTAFEHYKEGGALRSSGKHMVEYSHLSKQFSFCSTLTKEYFKEKAERGSKSNQPVFIVGMPRSGTTLIEQVLSSIKDVYAAGELDFMNRILNNMDVDGKKIKINTATGCFENGDSAGYKERGDLYLEMIEKLAPSNSLRIIDKMPANFGLLGFIYLILPNAAFIHAQRHPIETCLSAYRLYFKHGQYWSDDLRTMGKYYRLYTEIMAHWKSVLPEGTIVEVKYEDMVNGLEWQSKELVTAIGLEWNEKCLHFHQNDRMVKTASLAQVRKPIYNSSLNRWRKYEPYLKPLLDEIGDLVDDYEKELDSTI